MIDTANDTGQTLVTICNYSEYQYGEEPERHTFRHSKRHTNDTETAQQRHTNGTVTTQSINRETRKQGNTPISFNSLHSLKDIVGAPREEEKAFLRFNLSSPFLLPEEWRDWALNHPSLKFSADELEIEAIAFEAYWSTAQSGQTQSSDWFAVWRRWIAKASKENISRVKKAEVPKTALEQARLDLQRARQGEA